MFSKLFISFSSFSSFSNSRQVNTSLGPILLHLNAYHINEVQMLVRGQFIVKIGSKKRVKNIFSSVKKSENSQVVQ